MPYTVVEDDIRKVEAYTKIQQRKENFKNIVHSSLGRLVNRRGLKFYRIDVRNDQMEMPIFIFELSTKSMRH